MSRWPSAAAGGARAGRSGRALLRRDGGCARPGCPEDRIERLHAHHMRHWLFGGRTDLDNLVLLCDADHGLVHDGDLVMTRRDGELVVLDPDGRRVWGRADAAFAGGRAGLDDAADGSPGQDESAPFTGVQPLDELVGRRPADARPLSSRRRPRSAGQVPPPDTRPDLAALVFPQGEPPHLPDTLEAGGERMHLAWAVGVLLQNRDLDRRLAAEAGLAA